MAVTVLAIAVMGTGIVTALTMSSNPSKFEFKGQMYYSKVVSLTSFQIGDSVQFRGVSFTRVASNQYPQGFSLTFSFGNGYSGSASVDSITDGSYGFVSMQSTGQKAGFVIFPVNGTAELLTNQ